MCEDDDDDGDEVVQQFYFYFVFLGIGRLFTVKLGHLTLLQHMATAIAKPEPPCPTSVCDVLVFTCFKVMGVPVLPRQFRKLKPLLFHFFCVDGSSTCIVGSLCLTYFSIFCYSSFVFEC